jgi:hypothetical protein
VITNTVITDDVWTLPDKTNAITQQQRTVARNCSHAFGDFQAGPSCGATGFILRSLFVAVREIALVRPLAEGVVTVLAERRGAGVSGFSIRLQDSRRRLFSYLGVNVERQVNAHFGQFP